MDVARLGAAIAFAALTTVSVAAAQRAGSPPASPAPGPRFTAIGCVSRQAPSGAARGASTRVTYLLTDPRGPQPTVYRLDGDATVLEFHVGHSVEITGPLSVPATGMMTLKVGALTYLATSCPKVGK